MGWAFCGKNRHGQNIGYGVDAECDEPGCTEIIDRGLGYLCGKMHDDEETCAKYYCGDHGNNYCGQGSCIHVLRETFPNLDLEAGPDDPGAIYEPTLISPKEEDDEA